MGLLNIFGNKKRVVLIVQCRLSSTRLPRKALLDLGGKTVLEWALASMKKVKADEYYLATDVESGAELLDIAKKSGYSMYAGSKEDVLRRFCDVIDISKADIVVRATADNPFLFYEAAQELLDEYRERNSKSDTTDYITWTGLPHGSGIEIFNAHSLLRAAEQTDSPYDHEHVGPALYKHTDNFNCLFLRAPNRYHYPELRTTIDVYGDYRRARVAADYIMSGNKGQKIKEPLTTEEILEAVQIQAAKYPMLLVPSVDKGHGTGHLRRCLELALKTGADIYIRPDATLEETVSLVNDAKSRGLKDYQIVNDLSHADMYCLAVTDLFVTDCKSALELSRMCPVASIDEGASDTAYADYLLDIIPSMGYNRNANCVEPSFIPLPENIRKDVVKSAPLKKALVVLGGEDPASLTIPAVKALVECNLCVTAIIANKDKLDSVKNEFTDEELKKMEITGPVDGLKEKLCIYDLVVTHYGFTAFEAAFANCAVILLGTTPLHENLAKKYGFACISASNVNHKSFGEMLKDPEKLYKDITTKKSGDMKLDDFISTLSKGHRFHCPVCGCGTECSSNETELDAIVARTCARTFRRCHKCGMLYMSWTLDEKQTEYNRAYFYEDYQKQYGKTYEEDFAAIKTQCIRRISIVDFIYRRRHASVTPTVLDIGCALGPFLDAANDSGWQVFGIDISQDAVEHVRTKLHYPASCAAFPDIDVMKEFGVDKFDAITMWYVIEHFQNLDVVLSAVSKLVKRGGIFAFSTPSAAGVSAKYNTQKFFEQSPSDHYTLWEPARAASILKKYGFSVVRVVSTGIHPERFPESKKKLGENVLRLTSRMFKLGDTFEIYCKKDV